ncbi:MAG: osmotically inducible protein [Frankiales bacterium]|nr:osmotically inducible protein [Frankiales bacterium]
MTTTAPPIVYVVKAQSAGGGTARAAAGSATITFDAGWAQPPSGLPGPAELLASAFAACLLKNVERSSQLLPFRYEHAEVEVRARRQDAPPKFVEISYDLRLVTDEPERRVELLHRNLRQYGTVYNTLAAVCDVHGEIVVTAASNT